MLKSVNLVQKSIIFQVISSNRSLIGRNPSQSPIFPPGGKDWRLAWNSYPSGHRNGYGKFYESDATGKRMLRYEGMWKHGVPHGNGTHYNDDGAPQNGAWENGILKKKKQSQEERQAIVKNIGPLKIETILPEFTSMKIDETVKETFVKAQGLERNSLMADAMRHDGVAEKAFLPFAKHPPAIQVISNDLRKSLPLVAAKQLQDIDLGDVTLPGDLIDEFEHETALSWLKSYASKYELSKPHEPSLIKALEELPIKRLVLGVGVPIDPAKAFRGEFSPGLIRREGENGEVWGYIAWTNNGVQWAQGTEYGPGGSVHKIMTEEVEEGSPTRRGWAIQSIDISAMKSLDAINLKDTLEKNLANALHMMVYRYVEEPVPTKTTQSTASEAFAPEVATMVSGEYKENDKRSVYKAHVYRRFDPSSIMMVTLVAMPINIRKGQVTENELKMSIRSHEDALYELVENASATKAV